MNTNKTTAGSTKRPSPSETRNVKTRLWTAIIRQQNEIETLRQELQFQKEQRNEECTQLWRNIEALFTKDDERYKEIQGVHRKMTALQTSMTNINTFEADKSNWLCFIGKTVDEHANYMVGVNERTKKLATDISDLQTCYIDTDDRITRLKTKVRKAEEDIYLNYEDIQRIEGVQKNLIGSINERLDNTIAWRDELVDDMLEYENKLYELQSTQKDLVSGQQCLVTEIMERTDNNVKNDVIYRIQEQVDNMNAAILLQDIQVNGLEKHVSTTRDMLLKRANETNSMIDELTNHIGSLSNQVSSANGDIDDLMWQCKANQDVCDYSEYKFNDIESRLKHAEEDIRYTDETMIDVVDKLKSVTRVTNVHSMRLVVANKRIDSMEQNMTNTVLSVVADSIEEAMTENNGDDNTEEQSPDAEQQEQQEKQEQQEQQQLTSVTIDNDEYELCNSEEYDRNCIERSLLSVAY
jgi:chromosome segregation ATPase